MSSEVYYRHEKRPAWGLGRLVAEEDDRVRLMFEDGRERLLKTSIAGLIEVASSNVPKDSKASAIAPSESKAKADDRLRRARKSTLIKAVRLGVRDVITSLKSQGAFADDTMVEMQKGLSRITADYARFLGTQPSIVKAVSAPSARKLIDEVGEDRLYDELGSRLRLVSQDEWKGQPRAYEDAGAAAHALSTLTPLLKRASDLSDHELDAFQQLLLPEDLKQEPENSDDS